MKFAKGKFSKNEESCNENMHSRCLEQIVISCSGKI